MDTERLESLFHRYFDEVLTAEEHGELEGMLRESSQAREAFWDSARLHALIRSWGQGEWGRQAAVEVAAPMPALRALSSPPRAGLPRPMVAPSRARPAWPRWPVLAAAAVAMVLGVLAWLAFRPREAAGPGPGIAVLMRASSAVWETGSTTYQSGQALRPGGTLRLKSGAFQVEFARGARVVVEGPAEFRLVSDNEGFLHYGRLSAAVPEPSHGFKVGTPDFAVVDLGTEFGCAVPLLGAAEVHVFAGEITVQSAAAKLMDKALRQTEALRIEGDKVVAIPADRPAFLSEEELAALDLKNDQGRLAAWNIASRALAARPDAVLHLNFEPAKLWERTLKNLARTAPPGSAAGMIGCEWVEGRGPGKHALEFKGEEDRLRLTIPGTFPSITLLAWVRLDALPNIQNSLLMSESFQPGEVHWYLYRGGKIGLGLGGGTQRGWEAFQSEPVLRPEMFGSWVFLASVYDGGTRTVTHYLNGQPVASGTLTGTPASPRLDTFEIGNYGVRPDDPRLPSREARQPGRGSRAFHGRMDEFTVLSTPLKAEEIQALYTAGQQVER